MPVVRMPDGQMVNMPDELTPELAARLKALQSTQTGAMPKGENQSWLDEVKGGLASAPINLYLGTKQLFGGLNPVEQGILAQNKEAEKKAPISSIVSNIASLVPASMIPGANTMAGSIATGALTGLAQPVDGEQTFKNILKEKAINTVATGASGAAGKYVGDMLGGAAQDYAANRTAKKTAEALRNNVRDATLAEGRQAGYVVPNSEIAPSFLGNRLESLGGKAAIKQEATLRNQQVTNALARQALGLPDDEAISQGTLEALRKTAGKPYQEIAALDPQSASDLEALKQTRNDAQGWFNAYNRSASPDDLAKAKALRGKADELEGWLEDAAVNSGRTDLPDALREARKQIAKSYTVERALNKGTGDVSAPVLGRLFQKDKPLSDGLDTVGKFATAFPKFTGEGAKTPAAGVSKTEALVSALLGAGGAAATGSPMGLAAAALPLASHPARALALSQALQKAPDYGIGMGNKALESLSPQAISLLLRGSAIPAIGLATE